MNKTLYRIYTLLCFILAGVIAAEASAQDMSGWSDKTVCRLLLSKPDEPTYLEEVISRFLFILFNFYDFSLDKAKLRLVNIYSRKLNNEISMICNLFQKRLLEIRLHPTFFEF